MIFGWYLGNIWMMRCGVFIEFQSGVFDCNSRVISGLKLDFSPSWGVVKSIDWMICRWYLDDIWMICGWYVGDIWMISGWYVGDIWMICGWYLNDIWVISGWCLSLREYIPRLPNITYTRTQKYLLKNKQTLLLH